MERHLCQSKYQKCKHWRTLEVVEVDGPMVKPLLDPLLFVFQPQLGAEDTIICLLNCI